MRETPHSSATKISTICALWNNPTSKAFVTGDLTGEMYIWTVSNQDEADGSSRIDQGHELFLGKGVSALGYLAEKELLLSAGGKGKTGLMVAHDLFTGQEVGDMRHKQFVSLFPV
jgi:WD40 repeat protein